MTREEARQEALKCLEYYATAREQAEGRRDAALLNLRELVDESPCTRACMTGRCNCPGMGSTDATTLDVEAARELVEAEDALQAAERHLDAARHRANLHDLAAERARQELEEAALEPGRWDQA